MEPEPRTNDAAAAYEPETAWHNSKILLGDGTFFTLGSAFIEGNTVLPTFVSTLTNSPLLIGLVSSIRSFGYLVPQLFVAGFMDRLPSKKPLMMKAGYVMRGAALGMALTALLAGTNKTLALVLFYIGLVALAFGDGFGSLPWMEIVAKTIPPNKRAGVFGRMQALGGIAAFVGGFAIQWLLGKSIGYPYNFAVTMFVGFLFLTGSLICMMFIREPYASRVGHTGTMIEYLKRLPAAWRSNSLFQKVIETRLLMGGLYLALPFFAIHAQKDLGFAPGAVGLFVSAQMVGSVGGGQLWGYLGDNHGSRWVVRLVTVSTLLTGVLALLARGAHFAGIPSVSYPLYLLLYACLGATNGGTWIGYSNYILDIAPPENRATLVGLFNTVAAPLTLLTVVGGWILSATNYTFLFVAEAVVVVCSVLSAWRLPDSRKFRS